MVSPLGPLPAVRRAAPTAPSSAAESPRWLLKPLQAAVDDGDRIHAVIRGSAINNDGSMKMTYAAPNGAAQADVIAEAHAVADVDSSTISYVETHGTGTPLGDPIEIEGLRRAFGVSDTTRPGPCVLGSVKSNIGHLAEASGIAGLIKTILCLKNRAIPATLHYTTPNPALNLERGPFVVQSEYDPVGVGRRTRRAGVSSFGVGGTNVHVVVEEAPLVPRVADPSPGPQVLRLSARTTEALDDYRAALAAELARPRRRICPTSRSPSPAPANEKVRTGGGGARPAGRRGSAAGGGARQRLRRRVGRQRRISHRQSRFPVSRARGAARRDGPRACTNPSRCSPRTSTGARTDSSRSSGIDLRKEVFDATGVGLGAHRPGPAGAVRGGIRPRAAGRVLRRSRPRPSPDTASASTWRPPWQACSTCRRRSRSWRCAHA